MTQTATIRNRRGQSLFIVHEGTGTRPLALLAHGLADVHDSIHMRAMAGGLLSAGYDILRWDATNSVGRSDGSLVNATLSSYAQDLEDVAAWAALQSWYRSPFILAGHSLGGGAAIRFAAAHPNVVSRLILMAPVVSGRLLRVQINPLLRTLWWFLGSLPEPSTHTRYRYELLHDGLKYDALKLAPSLVMPTTIIVGQADHVTRPAHQRYLYDRLPEGSRELVILSDAGHSFEGALDRVRNLLNQTARIQATG